MRYSITAKKDATIYERSGSMNTGIDEILEISKVVSASDSTNIYNSRALIKFDLSKISGSIVAGNIPSTSQVGAPKYFLKLYTNNAHNLEYKYGIETFPISESWNMGTGRTMDTKVLPGGVLGFEEEGVSWEYKDGRFYFGSKWATNPPYENATTGSYSTLPGGSTWYNGPGYISSQSFDYEATDLNINVTTIVNKWLDKTIPNEGFVIMRSGSNQGPTIDEEKNGIPYGSLKFFSTDTHTVYQPRLIVAWNDQTISGDTGISEIAIGDDNIVDIYNRGSYKISDRSRVDIIARPKFPIKTYSTQSEALTKYKLPTYSYWSVKDMITEETVIPFDSQSTWISRDSNGSYFNLWMDQFYEERRYKFIFKSVTGNYNYPTTEIVYDNDMTFKVVR
tara:strand:- start:233 stop:1411 length:1179 start_codon:yes stop_codon:yes gene_type:complete